MFKSKTCAYVATVLIFTLVAGCALKPQKKPAKVGTEPTIKLYINETGQIKQLKMEEYIQGVVAAEMDTNWPISALAAQAILARTFTLKQMKDKGGVPQHKADASTSVLEFQAYDAGKINDKVRQAVKLTRGQVVKYQGNYINAWFSACDGGTEASAKEGLAYTKEKTPYINAGVKDGCLTVTKPENKRWTAVFPVDVVSKAVNQTTGANPGDIASKGISILKKGPTGRAETFRVGAANVSGAALRLALGNEKMRSIYIDKVSLNGSQIVFSGKGYGHGVGMCQWGANKMAQQGKSPKDIVNFYFKNISIEQLWK